MINKNYKNKKLFFSLLMMLFISTYTLQSLVLNDLLQAKENTSQQEIQKNIDSSNHKNSQSSTAKENKPKQTDLKEDKPKQNNIKENNTSSTIDNKQTIEQTIEQRTEQTTKRRTEQTTAQRTAQTTEQTTKQTTEQIENYPLFNPQNVRDGTYRTKNDFILLIENGIASIDGIKIVNKSIPVSETVASSLSQEIEEAFIEMQSAISKEGMYIKIVSGYRNFATQEVLYANYLASDNKENTETYSARPGHSEHHLGEAIDVGSDRDLSLIKPQYLQSKWLEENCYKYGFILRYPENKKEYTGFICEPWHFRYVGKDLAKILYNNGDWITLEEYYGLPSEYLE